MEVSGSALFEASQVALPVRASDVLVIASSWRRMTPGSHVNVALDHRSGPGYLTTTFSMFDLVSG